MITPQPSVEYIRRANDGLAEISECIRMPFYLELFTDGTFYIRIRDRNVQIQVPRTEQDFWILEYEVNHIHFTNVHRVITELDRAFGTGTY